MACMGMQLRMQMAAGRLVNCFGSPCKGREGCIDSGDDGEGNADRAGAIVQYLLQVWPQRGVQEGDDGSAQDGRDEQQEEAGRRQQPPDVDVLLQAVLGAATLLCAIEFANPY